MRVKSDYKCSGMAKLAVNFQPEQRGHGGGGMRILPTAVMTYIV